MVDDDDEPQKWEEGEEASETHERVRSAEIRTRSFSALADKAKGQ